jgi:hypothetical protein
MYLVSKAPVFRTFWGQNAQPQGLIRSNGLRFKSFGLTNMARQKGRDVTGIPCHGKQFFAVGIVTHGSSHAHIAKNTPGILHFLGLPLNRIFFKPDISCHHSQLFHI